MIVAASRPPLTLQRIYKMAPAPRRVRPRRAVKKKITNGFDIVQGVRLTAEMFTVAVGVYSTLQYFMYRRIRKELEEREK